MRKEVGRDLALAAGLAVLVPVGAVTAPPGRTGLDLLGVSLLVLAALVLVLRRAAPLPVLAVTTLCLATYLLRGYPGVVAAVPEMFALHAAVKAGHRPLAGLAVLAALAAGFGGDLAFGRSGEQPPEVFQRWFLLVGWLVAASVAGELSRQRGLNLAQAQRRAEDAEATREETARRRADAERLRIARELHDSLTHCISIVKVQAGVAVHLAHKRNEPVPEALLAIQQASGEAMRELRSTLEVLRDDAPRPRGLDRLDALLAEVREAGLPVQLVVGGQPRPLPAPVDLAAYRIVQESLTNIARHAGTATASVRLEYREDEVDIAVADDGEGTRGRDFVPGVGLLGMRERVGDLGGSLRAGPRPEGGFAVHAT
ncbi:sensor histidine kinase, partial [Amycolatopsis rhizosphaerae]